MDKVLFVKDGMNVVLRISPEQICVCSFKDGEKKITWFLETDMSFIDNFIAGIVRISRILEPDNPDIFFWSETHLENDFRKCGKTSFAYQLCRNLIKDMYRTHGGLYAFIGGENVYKEFVMLCEEEVMRWLMEKIDNVEY